MPRLSNSDYLLLATYLHEVRQTRQHAFTLVSTRDQHYLHLFFQPSKDLTESRRLAHRAAIAGERPSLPACAGQALRHLANPPPLQQALSNPDVIYPLLRPEPDVARMASALLDLAREQLRQERADPYRVD